MMIYVINLTGIFPLGYGAMTVSELIVRSLLFGLVGSVAAAAIIGYLLRRQPASNKFVYEMIGFTYWGTFYGTASIIDSMIAPISGYSPAIRFLSFTMLIILSGYAFISGIAQMVTGGWGSLK